MIRIIFLGPPGSGKGTQAHLISNKYNIPNISAGEILRKSFFDNKRMLNESMHNTMSIVNSGNLVHDQLIIKLIIKRIIQDDCKNGFLLDGFPRTIGQAESIKQNNISIDFVIEFNIPDSIIVDRIVGRQVHVSSGRIYHTTFNPPKHYGLDDITGEQLTIRKDDHENAVRQRLYQYRKYTDPIAEYYKKQSKKENIRYYIVNSNRKIINIYRELIDILQS